MFKLVIVFLGLIAFVEKRDGTITVLLPDASRPQAASDRTTIPAHIPLLIFSPEDSSEAAVNGLWLQVLNEKKLTLSGASDVSLTVDWPGIVSIEKHASIAKDIDPDVLDVKSPLVVSSISLEVGTLSGVKRKDDSPNIYFKPLTASVPANPNTGIYSIGAQYTMTFDKAVKLRVEPANEAPYDVEFIGKPPSGNGDPKPIEIYVVNMPFDPFRLDHRDADPHFELFYELAKSRPAFRNRPVPHFLRPSSSVHGGSLDSSDKSMTEATELLSSFETTSAVGPAAAFRFLASVMYAQGQDCFPARFEHSE